MKKFSLALLISMIAFVGFAQEKAPQDGDKKGPPPARGEMGDKKGERPPPPKGEMGEKKGERPPPPKGEMGEKKGERPPPPKGEKGERPAPKGE